jgi:hypothetical protein
MYDFYWADLEQQYLDGEITFDEMWEEKSKRSMARLNFTPEQYYRDDFRDGDNKLKEFVRASLDLRLSSLAARQN